MDGLPQRKLPEEKKVELEVQRKYVNFGFVSFETNVLIDSGNKITFTEDIDVEDPSLMSEIGLRDLIDAGIIKKGNPADCKSNYELAGDGYNGSVHIDKDDLNNAIKNGKLKVGEDEDGDIVLL